MKKKIPIIVACVVLLIIVGVIIFLFSTGRISIEKVPKAPTIIINKDKDGRTFTSDIWIWEPDIRMGKITYIPDTSYITTRDEVLQIDDKTFVTLRVKDVSVVCDGLKVIYGRDGQFITQIYDNCPLESLESTLGLTDCYWEDDVMFTKTTLNGAQIIATSVGDTAVVSKIYYDDEIYSTIMNSYRNGLYCETVEAPDKSSKSDLASLPVDKTYLPTASYDWASLVPESFRYADGYLNITHDLRSFNEIKSLYEITMNALSNETLTRYYRKDNIYYMEAGVYTCAIVTISSNNNVILLGDGNESRANILFLLESYE